MKKSTINLIVILFITSLFYNCKEEEGIETEIASIIDNTLPQDVIDSCNIDKASFDTWFADGKSSKNGFVNPANSVTFDAENNCSFYKWSHQMFLWLTSSGSKYNGGSCVLESPVFYIVSPETDKKRTLMPYIKGESLDATIDIAKINSEEGQATNNVLLDRHGNLVYYITFVNDVYVALLNMAVKDSTSVTQFPTKKGELDNILAFAKENNINVLEPNALAMELKTSWIKLDGDMKKEDFVTITADVPVFDTSNNNKWVINGEEKVTLALVGMHIVGSANGHPEMIWSTFEHKYNTPNAMYQYVNKDKKVVTVKGDNDGYWLFNSNPKDTSYANSNNSYAKYKNEMILANEGNTIKPSNTIRILPCGSAYNLKPNQQNLNSAYANSEVISINNSIANKLDAHDVRNNYFLIGSTWTFNGMAPNGESFVSSNNYKNGEAIGTSNLANSTMETDFQEKSPMVDKNNNNTCFTCHSAVDTNKKPTLNPKIHGLSHIFLPLMQGLMKK